MKSPIFYKIKMATRLFKEIKNPISSILYYIGKKNEVTVKTRKIGEITFKENQKSLLYSLMLTLPYLNDADKKEYKNFFKQASELNPIIKLKEFDVVYEGCTIFAERYAEYPYSFKNEKKDEIIIDIGSNVGDTALEFAYDGLTVYGFEPVKRLYETSLKNLELNPHLKDKINIYNYGVSYKSGTITIDSMESTSLYTDSNDSYDIEVITIKDILNKFNIKPKFLKMDCEGCEFDIIRNTDLSNFDEIILEHHAGYKNENYLDIINILKEQGFEIELIPLWMYDIEYLGIIHAYKN